MNIDDSEFSLDDPKSTAYALDELNAAARIEVAQEMERSVELRGAIEEIRAAYANEAVIFPWENNDILVLDNMLTAHGRRPYRGGRRIVVGMG